MFELFAIPIVETQRIKRVSKLPCIKGICIVAVLLRAFLCHKQSFNVYIYCPYISVLYTMCMCLHKQYVYKIMTFNA